MAYDAGAASRRLISAGLPAVTPVRLSRRHRLIAVGYDVVDDVAVTLFLRRGGSGQAWWDALALERRGDHWVPLGGGSGRPAETTLPPRQPAAELHAVLCHVGGGITLRNSGRLMPWGARYVGRAHLQAAAEVDHVLVDGRRIEVPAHGNVVVAWTSRRPPHVTAIDADGRPLMDLPLPDARRHLRYVRRRAFRRIPRGAALTARRSGAAHRVSTRLRPDSGSGDDMEAR